MNNIIFLSQLKQLFTVNKTLISFQLRTHNYMNLCLNNQYLKSYSTTTRGKAKTNKNDKKDLHWVNYILPLDNISLLNNDLITKSINEFWTKQGKLLDDNKHMLILFRIQEESGVWSTLGQLKKVNKNMKNYYIKFVTGVLAIKSDEYQNMNISRVAISFGVDIQKGIFPHRFVKADNLIYIGPVPAWSYFDGISQSEYNADCQRVSHNWSIKMEANNKKLDEITKSDIGEVFMVAYNKYYEFLETLSPDKIVCVFNIIIGSMTLSSFCTVLSIMLSENIINRISFLDKYPRILKLLSFRNNINRKISKFYLLTHVVVILWGLIANIYMFFI